MKASVDTQFRYPFEEFMDHVRAMKTVRTWEYTTWFGHVGAEQSNRANSARVLEYFMDTYEDRREALHKAEVFLSIYDYIGRNTSVFSRKGLVDELGDGSLSVETVLLRAMHYVFVACGGAEGLQPRRILNLTHALKALEPST